MLSFDSLKSLFSLENNIFKYIHGLYERPPFEFLFMIWRKIRKLRKIGIENILSYDPLKSLFSLEKIIKFIINIIIIH